MSFFRSRQLEWGRDDRRRERGAEQRLSGGLLQLARMYRLEVNEGFTLRNFMLNVFRNVLIRNKSDHSIDFQGSGTRGTLICKLLEMLGNLTASVQSAIKPETGEK